ncbi:MAG: hydroxyacylglutathione hydrolase [Oligoflexia bacterium]|nr:hydroxyacylglutathione hydrolase [Oligoflexia bacterium]
MINVNYVRAFQDNYIYIITGPFNNYAIVVDPGESSSLIDYLTQKQLQLWGIFITHHHHDHTDGIQKLKQRWPEVKIMAGTKEKVKIPYQNVFLNENDLIETPLQIGPLSVLHVPGHTLGHIVYYWHAEAEEQKTAGHLFSGDLLFGASCGNIFEGTPEQMFTSLQKIRNLPPNTKIWCAHEYTLEGLVFASKVEPNNLQIANRLIETKKKYSEQEPTIPLILEIERETNPYLRWDSPSLQKKFNVKENDLECFLRLNELE